MLQEISRTSVPTYRNEDVSISWHNSVVTVRTENDVYLFELSHNLQCLDKKIDLLSSTITVPKSSPLTGHIPKHFLGENVRNIDYTEMILDPALWPHNPNMVQEMTNIADLQWSPAGFLPGHENALAILNNIGSVELYRKGRFEFTKVLNLSKYVEKKYFSSGEMTTPVTLEELKALAYSLATSAICWGPDFDNNSCLLATAQKNGNILFWILFSKDCVKPELIGEIQTKIGEAVTMILIPKSGKEFLLICSNVLGQIFALDCGISDNNYQVQVKSDTLIWQQKDKMVSKHIQHNIVDDKIVLFCNKHRHLIVIVVDKNGQVVKQQHKNVNDYKITDIKCNSFGTWLTTVNSKIYKVILQGLVDNLEIHLELVETNEPYSTQEMYGIAFSTNNVIWTVALKNTKIIPRQRSQKTVNIVFLYDTNSNLDELTLLLHNPLKKLTYFWDCIELLRYRTIKSKSILLSIDYIYQEADKDIYKLKVYFVLLNFFLSIEKLVRNKERVKLPEMSLDTVKEKILALHASQLIDDFQENPEMFGKMPSGTYHMAERYLDYYCKKYKRNKIEYVATAKKLPNIPNIVEQITCQCCDDNIDGFTCKSGHFNMFCSLTFTPIDSFDYLVCKSCHSMARSELYSNNSMCVFCDLYLNDIQFANKKH